MKRQPKPLKEKNFGVITLHGHFVEKCGGKIESGVAKFGNMKAL